MPPKSAKTTKPPVVQDEQTKRSKLSQKDVPSMTMDKALRLAKAIVDNYASKPVTPLKIAQAIDMTPTSGSFRMLCGASVAYGLTIGGYNVEKIELTPLALRILKPKNEGDDYKAKVEAFLTPRVIKDFIQKYNGSPIPKAEIAKNVLEEMGVPSDKLDYVLSIIVDEGERLKIISTLKDKKYVEIPTDFANIGSPQTTIDEDEEDDELTDIPESKHSSQIKVKPVQNTDNPRLKRVFITHGKNRDFIEPIKKLLKFGELEAVVSVDKTSVSVPVPDKVMNDMRSCGAAIIHVEGEMEVLDKNAQQHIILNPNVLIEIGAAIALYGKRFILLVKDGAKLPSNLQGLFEVRYTGDALDGETTIKLLEAINDIKNQKLPEEQS